MLQITLRQFWRSIRIRKVQGMKIILECETIRRPPRDGDTRVRFTQTQWFGGVRLILVESIGHKGLVFLVPLLV